MTIYGLCYAADVPMSSQKILEACVGCRNRHFPDRVLLVDVDCRNGWILKSLQDLGFDEIPEKLEEASQWKCFMLTCDQVWIRYLEIMPVLILRYCVVLSEMYYSVQSPGRLIVYRLHCVLQNMLRQMCSEVRVF